MNHADIEFLAEKEIVEIVPNFNSSVMYFISGDVGPFNAGLPIDVPLWLAISLKQRQKCRIKPPSWMTVENLEEIKENEVQTEIFTHLPNPHFREFSQLLFTCATDNIPNADQVRTLIKDIWDIRDAKLKKGVDQFVKRQAPHAKLDNLTQMEINSIRPFLTAALDQMYKLKISQRNAGRTLPSQ